MRKNRREISLPMVSPYLQRISPIHDKLLRNQERQLIETNEKNE